MNDSPIPYERLEALFLDAGNTLVGIDPEVIASELARRGHHCEPGAVARSEAAVRPAVCRGLQRGNSTESQETSRAFLGHLLADLVTRGRMRAEESERRRLVDEVLPWFRSPPTQARLWSRVIEGAPELLEDLRAAGFPLVVVSNSNGSCASLLEGAGLLDLVDAVVDSGIVGVEKPDPRIFERALAISGSDPGRTLHVGDIYSVDVLGARRAGLHGLLVDPHGDWSGVDCPRIEKLEELRARLLDGRPG